MYRLTYIGNKNGAPTLREARSQDERTQNIAANANRIMGEMRKEKENKEMKKRATEAKIRAILLLQGQGGEGKKEPSEARGGEF